MPRPSEQLELTLDEDSDEGQLCDTEVDSQKAGSEQRNAEEDLFTQWLQSQKTRGPIERHLACNQSRITSISAPAQMIISTPREYQMQLFERAKEQNTIVVLDTGSGKTLIAALLLRYCIGEEYEARKQGRHRRISIFLVDKIALAKQQWRVLKSNLDCHIACFAGDPGGAPRTQEYWKQQLEENEVIVCTGAIILKALHHSYIKMEQINLICFDEAHHAKKEHPYARIIKDFYLGNKQAGKRTPRVFGMTASPVDQKTDFERSAIQLEDLLNSKIATVSNQSLLHTSFIHQAREHVIEFSAPSDPFETALCQKLKPLLGSLKVADKLFVYAKEATSELGVWCADRLWQLTFDEAGYGLKRLQSKLQAETDITLQDTTMEAAQAAHLVVISHHFATLSESMLKHKVIRLRQLLHSEFRPGLDKCVIFVAKRFTVALLTDLFQTDAMKMEGVNVGKLIGTGKTGWENPSMTIHEQMRTVQDFFKGKLNILFATTVAEEGLDIPDCNIIIRFDPCTTMIQYIQSRGRARQANSKLYHMVEAGDRAHISLIRDFKEEEKKMRDFCSALPPDRRVDDEPSVDFLLAQQSRHPAKTIESTNAKLTYKMSLEIIADFVHALPTDSDKMFSPDYVCRTVPGGYRAELILPDHSPVKNIIGQRESSKQLAKCAAAFDMVLELRKKKCIDDWLKPIYTKKLPEMRNARLALTSNKVGEYTMQVKPNFWIRGRPDELFLVILKLRTPSAVGRDSVPLAMLSRLPMPEVRDIPLYFADQRCSQVEVVFTHIPLKVDEHDLQLLTSFTLRIFQDVFSKVYSPETENIPYFLAPLVHGHAFDFESFTNGDPRRLLDWTQLNFVNDTDYLETEKVAAGHFEDRFVSDPHNGGRKFYTTNVVPDLKPSDPQSPTAFRSARNRVRDRGDDIWNYSISLWSSSRDRIVRRDDLPVVSAEYIQIRQNLLDSTEVVEQNVSCFIVFQTLQISALSTKIVAMAYTLPAILYRIESTLIAKEACALVSLSDIDSALALEAITKNSDNTGEYDTEQVNLQHGMGNNYERLEFLGDSFLKMSTTIALFARAPRNSEFFQHVERMTMINNKNLYQNALELKLPEKVRTRAFNRRWWYPQGLVLLKGKQNDSIQRNKQSKQARHALSAKTIADVCEALIGASYLTAKRQNNMDLSVRAVTTFVKNKKHNMEKWEDYYPCYQIPDWQTAQAPAAQEILATTIEEKLGYAFKSPQLVRSAFTHPSYSSLMEGLPHYQQLEFLGDALLEMVCVDYLFHKYTKADPQWLTEYKMAMVSNQFLAFLCVSLDIHRHLLLWSNDLSKQISQFADAVTLAREDAEAKVEAKGLLKESLVKNFWMDLGKPPKALGDVVEAYLGAVFVDSKFDFSEVQKFFNLQIRPYFEDMTLYDTYVSKQPITQLFNTFQNRFHCAKWRLMCRMVPKADGSVIQDDAVCAVMIHNKIISEPSIAASERYAKIAAAKNFNVVVDSMSTDEFRKKYGCDCKMVEGMANVSV